MFRKVVVVSRVDREDAVKLSSQIIDFIRGKGLTVTPENQLASKLGVEGESLNRVKGDLVVVVGGDGTVLWTIHNMATQIPLFVIKFGRVGFFADVTPEEAFSALEKVFHGNYMLEECLMLKTSLDLPEALNEVRIGTLVPQQMVDISVFVEDERVAKDRVDAIVVATPVGSSAYALSAGANIVDPNLEAFLIVPICPLSSNFKPHVIPTNFTVTIKPESQTEYLVLVDGQIKKTFTQPLTIKIWKSERKTVFVRTRKNFYERLRRRLNVSCVDF